MHYVRIEVKSVVVYRTRWRRKLNHPLFLRYRAICLHRGTRHLIWIWLRSSGLSDSTWVKYVLRSSGMSTNCSVSLAVGFSMAGQQTSLVKYFYDYQLSPYWTRWLASQSQVAGDKYYATQHTGTRLVNLELTTSTTLVNLELTTSTRS